MTPPLKVEYCGEWYTVDGSADFGIGREAELTIDENPYLHRRFLLLRHEYGMWWLVNAGALLSATVTDASGLVQAWLAPGAKLPLVFPVMHVMFSAGSTTYDFAIHLESDFFHTAATAQEAGGSTTIVPVALTTSQRRLVVALAEHVLTQSVPGRGVIPTSAEAAERLGWSMTTFNRKLDNVCEKLDRLGVQGLRGGRGKLATSRRSRLVEYAVATHLVGPEDVALLDRDEVGVSADSQDEDRFPSR